MSETICRPGSAGTRWRSVQRSHRPSSWIKGVGSPERTGGEWGKGKLEGEWGGKGEGKGERAGEGPRGNGEKGTKEKERGGKGKGEGNGAWFLPRLK